MDPKRTREALADYENPPNGDGAWENDHRLGQSLAVLADTAQWAVGLFEKCENCEGKGIIEHCGHGLYVSHVVDCGTRASSPCPSCDGRGYVLNRERVERAVGAHAEVEGFISPLDDAFVSMRAAISAFLFGDPTETRQEET